MPIPSVPTRADRQRQTRQALVHAARAVFSEVGYHAASLEGIARAAGYSKGAVYSNFENKAQLFLAVLDENLQHELTPDGWDLGEQCAHESASTDAPADREIAEAIRGFGLATLEFIASAARDDSLKDELGLRMDRLVDGYAQGISGARADDDPLSATDLGALLVALNQGASLLMLSGSTALAGVLQVGVHRLLNPADPVQDGGDSPLLRVAERDAHLAGWVRREYGSMGGESEG